MKKSMDNFLPYYLIRSICSILLIVFQFPTAIAQNLEVDGKVKVIEMDSIGTGEKIVVRDPNSILAECNVDNIIISYFLSLPNGTATLVEAGESAANLLALGATVANLLNAGVSVGELLATGVSVNELVTAGATVSSLLEAGAVPLDIFNAGIPIDSFYGQFYEGGLIFYLNISTGEGLVAADEDQGYNIIWGSYGFTGATGTNIGDGQTNTAAIVVALGSGNYAARICDNLILNGKDDWFLPSNLELLEMNSNLYLNNFGDFGASLYWSSTEDSGTNANRIMLGGMGSLSSRDKQETSNGVRAVRAF